MRFPREIASRNAAIALFLAAPLLKLTLLLAVVLAATSPLFAAGEDRLLPSALSLLKKKDFQNGTKKYFEHVLFANTPAGLEVRKNHLRSVKDFFLATVKSAPGDTRSLIFLSLVYRMVNLIEPAQKIMEDLLIKNPDSPLLLLLKSEYSLSEAKTTEAETLVQKLKDNPRGAKLWGLVQKIQKRYGLGIDRKARREILLREAFKHYDQMEGEAAEKGFRFVLEEYPGDPDAAQGLIELLIEQKQLDEADRVLKKFKTMNPTQSSLPFIESRLRIAQGRFDSVIPILEPISRKDPGNTYVKALLAEVYYQVEKYGLAKPLFKELHEGDPNNPGFISRLLSCIQFLKEYDFGIALLKGLIVAKPKDYYLLFELGNLYENGSRFQEAIASYDQICQTENPFREMARERCESCRQKESDALESDENTVESDPPASAPSDQASGSIDVTQNEAKKIDACYSE